MAEVKESLPKKEMEKEGRQGGARETVPAVRTGENRHVEVKKHGPEQKGEVVRPVAAAPFSFMRSFFHQVDRLFEDFGFGPWSGRRLLPSSFAEDAWLPDVEVSRKGDKLVVRADLPGLRKEDVRVEVVDNQLILEGERRQKHEEEREGFFCSERSYGRFYRVIPLPEGTDTREADATFRDGVLEVEMKAPPLEESRGRKVEVR